MLNNIAVYIIFVLLHGYAISIKNPFVFNPLIKLDTVKLKEKLSCFQFRATTIGYWEDPGTGEFLNHSEKGTYNCLLCNIKLFSSEDKIESNNGYANFHTSLAGVWKKKVIYISPKRKYWGPYNPLRCRDCGNHLGNSRWDDDTKSHRRYTVNSVALKFEPDVGEIP